MNENSLGNKPPESQKPKQEQLEIRVEVAGPEDWEVYRDIRFTATAEKDRKIMGISLEQIKRERNKTEEEWRQDFFGDNKFVVLARNDAEVVGMGLARKRPEEGVWHMFSDYVKENFRGRDIGKRIFATRLDEIRKRGGKKVTIAIKAENTVPIHIAESFGFKKQAGFFLQLEDVNNPIVISKINEVLNAG